MNDMERRKFEDSFQEAFKDAEVSPSENVWTNIELDLVKAEGDKMKRRLVFFKMLAAASVVFALCVGGVGYYIFNNNPAGELAQTRNSGSEQLKSSQAEISAAQDTLADQKPQSPENEVAASKHNLSAHSATKGGVQESGTSRTEKQSRATSSDADHASGHDENAVANNNTVGAEQPLTKASTAGLREDLTSTTKAEKMPSSNNVGKSVNTESVNTLSKSLQASTLIDKSDDPSEYAYSDRANTRALPIFYQPTLPKLEIKEPATVADPGMLLLAKLADEEKEFAREEKQNKKNKNENLWTSVGFAAGGFNANNPSVTPTTSNSFYAMNSATTNTAAKQSKASGAAYSVGVSLGTRLSDRWVLQGGFNYLTQSSDYTANGVVVKDNNYAAPEAESLNAFFDKSSDAASQPLVAQTYPYNVNNSVRFVSVPLQAGYLVVNKKFGLQVNAGVSTDLFLQNTITPDGGGLTRTTQGRGDDSPYRSLNFSGLMGTEFSYRIGNHYRVALNPGFRYPFSSIYKPNTGVDANPLTFDVGVRFRYIFH